MLLLGAIVVAVLAGLRLPWQVWGAAAIGWVALWRAWDWLKVWAVKRMENMDDAGQEEG